MTRHNAKRLSLLPAALLLFAAAGFSLGQTDLQAETDQMQLRVCAPSTSLPFSHSNGTGFENRIAGILADELDAELVFDWHPFNADLVNRRFGEGHCDVIMGVPDGFGQTMSTLSYYQSPYVQVRRADAGFEVQSMDDPILRDLSIAVLGTGTPPHEALRVRGLQGNVTERFGTEEGEDNLAGLVNAIVAGDADIGFGWGPVVAYYAARSDVDLVITPIEPMFDFPSIFQVQPMVMAVRPNDYAMQARLNLAIAARWDDIQAVLAEYGVPMVPVPAPVSGAVRDLSRNLRIGVVLPMPSGAKSTEIRIYDLVADAARQGAILADGMASQSREPDEVEVSVLFGSSPSASSAVQQALAMVALDEVDALVGGVGSGQAEGLARVAEEAGIPFLNIGSTSLELRGQCRATTFHVQPSAAMYLDAMVEFYGNADAPTNWFVVYEDTAESALMLAAAEDLIGAAGDQLLESVSVPKSRPVYHDIFAQAEQLQVDGIILLLDPADQLALIGQAEDAGYGFNFAPFPDTLTQTREFLASSKLYGAGTEVPRLELWDTTLDSELAADLNARFTGQFGQPFDAPAWAAFAAVSILTEAARLADSTEAGLLMDAIFEVDAGAIGGKELPMFFSESSRELAQTLYAVEVNVQNEWGIRPSTQVNAGTLLEVIPPDGSDSGIVCD